MQSLKSYLYLCNKHDQTYCCSYVDLISPSIMNSPLNDVWVGVGFHDLRDTAADGATIITGQWIKHDKFDPTGTGDHDIALIKLDQPAVLSNRVQPIPVMSAGSDVAWGTDILISGWGKLSRKC